MMFSDRDDAKPIHTKTIEESGKMSRAVADDRIPFHLSLYPLLAPLPIQRLHPTRDDYCLSMEENSQLNFTMAIRIT
jgi:hypothetical protein